MVTKSIYTKPLTNGVKTIVRSNILGVSVNASETESLENSWNETWEEE